MIFNLKGKTISKIKTIALSMCIVFSSVTVFAEEPKKIQFEIEEITEEPGTLMGEARALVRVKGASGKLQIAQLTLNFDGDLTYKSTEFLKGDNNVSNGNVWIDSVGDGNRLMTSIISTNGITISDSEDDEKLFILTFEGEAGKSVSLKLDDLDKNYCKIDGTEVFVENKITKEITASSTGNEGRTAVISLKMDKVPSFIAKGDSGITVKITNEAEGKKGKVITTQINPSSETLGGHRNDDSLNIPIFDVEKTVVAGDTYTVEVSGIGFVSAKKTNVDFSTPVEFTNADFIPGDINNDGKVTIEDKKAVQKLIDEGKTNLAADFNRDGKTDTYDMAVFADIKDEDNGNSGSDNGNSGNNQGSGESGSTGGSTGGGSTGGYVGGLGGGGSTGGGGGGYVGGGSTGGGSYAGGSSNETFVDLGNHTWAKDSIYTLKNKGIISGVSANEFAPANNIKRGDFILILTRMLSINNAFTENFVDVPVGSYYYNAIGSAKVAGIATGDGQNFMPEESITRQDLITLAYRAFLAKGWITKTEDLTILDTFADSNLIGDYAKEAMASMVKAGIIQGSDGNVNPLGYATRAEVAVMCARMLNLMQ